MTLLLLAWLSRPLLRRRRWYWLAWLWVRIAKWETYRSLTAQYWSHLLAFADPAASQRFLEAGEQHLLRSFHACHVAEIYLQTEKAR